MSVHEMRRKLHEHAADVTIRSRLGGTYVKNRAFALSLLKEQ
jgi:hypothetical protein